MSIRMKRSMGRKVMITVCMAFLLCLGLGAGNIFALPGEEEQGEALHREIYLDLTGDGQEEKVTIRKGEGTASLLSYQVWHRSEAGWTLWLERENLYQGVVTAAKGEVREKVPFYQEGDANALPSGYVERVYHFTPEGATLSREQTVTLPKIQLQGEWQNPPRAEIEAMLRQVALDKGIPPVILKSLAYTESNLRQFHNGEPLQSFDKHSWGIMQVTPAYHPQYDLEKLKYDIEYNMRAGAEIFLQKWNLAFRSSPAIPTIGSGDPQIRENWYFALWAYNGWSQNNNPNMIPYEHATWTQTEAYQCKVLRHAYEQFATAITPIPPEELPLEGRPAASTVFATPVPFSLGEYRSYGVGDYIIASSTLNLRNNSWQTISPSLRPNQVMEVLEGPLLYNGYFRYRIITREDGGKLRTGWVAMNWTLPRPPVLRIFGGDRYHTAVAISQTGWHQADTVLLARGDDYADALAGVPLAYQLDAPVLLTHPHALTVAARDEILRLGAKKVIILGGPEAVSTAVDAALLADPQLKVTEVERLAGSNRYDTAQIIALRLADSQNAGGSSTAILAYGQNFPDALAVAPYAAAQGIPILLTQTNTLPSETQAALAALEVQNVLVVGGSNVISEDLFSELPAPTRISGPDRYATAVAISQHFDPLSEFFYVATGQNFADAITGGVLAAKNQTGILLVGENVPASVSDYIASENIKRLTVYGGFMAVSAETGEGLASLLQ